MANLEHIKKLNRKFEKDSPILNYDEIKMVNEAIDPDRIEKAIQNQVANFGPSFARYFHYGLPAKAALLFIDVCGFSIRYGGLNGDDIGEYFDAYYEKIIPIIYDHGGEIDKIIGDGVIAIFAPPFFDEEYNKLIHEANVCATRIIQETKGTEFSSKVALHCGTINYFQNKTGLYNEFTVIGKPMTELFRLESVSEDEKVNFFADTAIHDLHKPEIEKKLMMDMTYGMILSPYSRHHVVGLKGVEFGGYYSLKI